MKPCDCKDRQDLKKLVTAGVCINNIGLDVSPAYVKIHAGPCTVKIYQKHFEMLARWYLEDKEKESL